MNKKGFIDFSEITPAAAMLGGLGFIVGGITAKFYSKGLPANDGHASIIMTLPAAVLCAAVGFIWGQRASS